MKILILEDKASVAHGGAEKSMFDYILHLKELGHEIHLVYDRSGDWLDDKNISLFSSVNKISVLPITVQGVKNYTANLFKLISIIKNNQIDLMFTHVIHGFPFLRIVKSVTNIKIKVYFKWVPNTDSIGLIGKWGAGSVEAAFSPTNFVARYRGKNGISPTIQIVPDGIFRVSGTEQVKYSRINKFLFLGRIYEGKGLHLVIKALAKFDDMRLMIGGFFDAVSPHENYTYHKHLLELIDNLSLNKRIVFLNEIKDPYKYMDGETLVIVPSIWPENQSRVLLEAMASKTPVIASEIGGLPEVVLGAEKECLFKPDENSLVMKINEVLTRPAEEQELISEMLYKRFQEVYEVSATQQRLDTLLELR